MGLVNWDTLDVLHTGCIWVDQAGFILRINAAAQSLLGISNRAVVGVNVQALVESSEALCRFFSKQGGSDAERQRMHWEIDSPNDVEETKTFDVLVQAIDDQALSGYLFELREIDLQIRQHREEKRLDFERANHELLRNLAHEVKNPLGGLRGAAQLLSLQLESEELKG